MQIFLRYLFLFVAKIKINVIPEKISKSIFVHGSAGEWRRLKN
jgi:hypothetical protein